MEISIKIKNYDNSIALIEQVNNKIIIKDEYDCSYVFIFDRDELLDAISIFQKVKTQGE